MFKELLRTNVLFPVFNLFICLSVEQIAFLIAFFALSFVSFCLSACINEIQKVYLSILLSKFGRLGFN